MPTTSSASNQQNIEMALSPSQSMDSEFIKNKKLKAKARQQRILAQMSSSQQTFISNPSNKLDVEGFKETSTSPQSVITSSLSDLSNESKDIKQIIETVATTSSDTHHKIISEEEEYECCICRLAAADNLDRPLGAVTLLQPTSVLGHRESITIKEENINRKLPLSDDINYKQLQTETLCWKQKRNNKGLPPKKRGLTPKK